MLSMYEVEVGVVVRKRTKEKDNKYIEVFVPMTEEYIHKNGLYPLVKEGLATLAEGYGTHRVRKDEA